MLFSSLVWGTSGKGAFITFSGSFNASASTATVTGTSRTVTVVGGGSRTLDMLNESIGGTSLEYRYNAGAFATVEGASISVADASTLQFRASGAATWTSTVDLYDHATGKFLTQVAISRV